MTERHLRGKGPLLTFESLWSADKDYLGLIVGFHDLDGNTVYGKMIHCHEAGPGLIQATISHKNGTETHTQLALDAPMRVLTQRRCPWCGQMFYPRHQDQRFCEPDHEDAQTVKHRATRKLIQQTCHSLGVTCLCPEKRPYFSRAEALTGAKNSRRHYGTRLSPYLCICERWHLGHPTKTPEWLTSGTLAPTVERIGHYLESHGVDTADPRFRAAAEAALEWYATEVPQTLPGAEITAEAARC